MRMIFLVSAILLGMMARSQKKNVDLLIYNAKIYTVDKKFSVASAIAIKDGKIEDVGSTRMLSFRYIPTQSINAQGKFIFPGFIDAHAHFVSYGLGLQQANLVGTKSWQEIIDKLRDYAKKNPEGWIIGRGWDQNDWNVKEFPDKEELDRLFPSRPVILRRVDGHAAIVNQAAIDMAALKPGATITGGQVEVKDGKLTGILVDNAIELVSSKIPAPTSSQIREGILAAQQNCFASGLTTIDDCGLNYRSIDFLDRMQKENELKMRLYVMLSDAAENFEFLIKNGKIKTDKLNVRSFKVYADGALGSRGAALLQPYSDKPGWTGFLLNSPAHYDSVAAVISANGFQMCTHAIGDSGNRTILNTYGKYLKTKNDLRWRIEHAQVVNEKDFHLFSKFNIIPSVQPTHATSDMYWASERLGPSRVKGAYAFRQLMEENGWLPLGTDFPVEDISPFKTFYAAVFRMDDKAYPAGGFQSENALTRDQAIRGMTIWAAMANFEEAEKGSLEKGKFADFVILDKDLMKIEARDVLTTSVIVTYLNGERVYSKN